MIRRIAAAVALAVGLSVAVVAPANAAPVRDYHHIGKVRDTGLITHKADLWWAHSKYANTARSRHWAKFQTWAHTVDLNGSTADCSPSPFNWGDFKYSHTVVSLHIWNANPNWAGIHMRAVLNCDRDTVDQVFKGMSHTPRVYWRDGPDAGTGGDPIRVRWFMVDHFYNWPGEHKIHEHVFNASIYHPRG